MKQMASLFMVLALCLATPALAKRSAYQEDLGLYDCLQVSGTAGSQAQLATCQTNAISANAAILLGPRGPLIAGVPSGNAITWTITSNLSITQPLYVAYGATIQVASGITLTIQSCPIAGPYQWLDADTSTTGTVVYSVSGECVLWPQAWQGNAPTGLDRMQILGNGTSKITIDSTGAVTGVGSATINASDTQVVFMDGTEGAGSDDFTFDNTNKIVSVTNGLQTNCSPATDANRCKDLLIVDTVSPTEGTSGNAYYGIVSNGTDAAPEWFANGLSAQRAQREPYRPSPISGATTTLTNEQCYSADLTHTGTTGWTLNLCATPRQGSTVCWVSTGAASVTINPDDADAILRLSTGATASNGEAIVCTAAAGNAGCVKATGTTPVWAYGDIAGSCAEETP